MIILVAVVLITLTGLDGQIIYVNPAEVVSIRAPTSDLLHENVKCSLQTVDGRIINVTNSCDEVHRLFNE